MNQARVPADVVKDHIERLGTILAYMDMPPSEGSEYTRYLVRSVEGYMISLLFTRLPGDCRKDCPVSATWGITEEDAKVAFDILARDGVVCRPFEEEAGAPESTQTDK